MKKFTVHVLGNIPETLDTQLKTKLSTELTKLKLKLEIIPWDEKKHIAVAYHETFNGEMLIIYGIPYGIPHFGSLSQDLFGLVEDQQTKTREYPKKIYIYASTELEQKAWRYYLKYLPDQFKWSGTQVTVPFPKPEEILKNTSIISNWDELILPTEEEIRKLDLRSPAENKIYQLNSKLQARFAEKYAKLTEQGTELLYVNEYTEKTRDLINPEHDRVIATVISCASDLKPHNEEHNAFMKKIGEVLAKQKILHVFGGTPMGIMWQAAKGSIEAGGEVFGIMGAPQCDTYTHQNPPSLELGALKKFIFAPSLQTRIKLLMNLDDIMIMLPAGTGTFEELTTHLVDSKEKPVVIVKVGNHLDHVEKHIRELQSLGFLHKSIHFIANEQDINTILVPLLTKTSSNLMKKKELSEAKKLPSPIVASKSITQDSLMISSTNTGKSASNIKWIVGSSLLVGAGIFALKYLVRRSQTNVTSVMAPSKLT